MNFPITWSTENTFHFTLVYTIDGKREERSVFVRTVLQHSDGVVTVEVTVTGHGKKSRKLPKKRKEMPAGATILREAFDLAQKLLPGSAKKVHYKNKTG